MSRISIWNSDSQSWWALVTWCPKESKQIRIEQSCSIWVKPGDAGKLIFLGKCLECLHLLKTSFCVSWSKKQTGGQTPPTTIVSVFEEARPSIKQFARRTWVDSHVYSWKTSRNDNTITWRTVLICNQTKPCLFTRCSCIGWNHESTIIFHSHQLTTSTTRNCSSWHSNVSKKPIPSRVDSTKASVKNSHSLNKHTITHTKHSLESSDSSWRSANSRMSRLNLWISTRTWCQCKTSTRWRRSPTLTWTNTFGMKQTSADCSRTGSSLLILNLHHCLCTSGAKA